MIQNLLKIIKLFKPSGLYNMRMRVKLYGPFLYKKKGRTRASSPQFLPLQNNASDRNILSDSNIIIIKKSYDNIIVPFNLVLSCAHLARELGLQDTHFINARLLYPPVKRSVCAYYVLNAHIVIRLMQCYHWP